MKNILLASHYTEVPGVMEKLEGYLKRKNHSLFYVLNPLYPGSKLKSVVKSGSMEVKYKIVPILQYFLEGPIALLNIKKKFKCIGYLDMALCFDPLTFWEINIMKKILKIKKIGYFNVDYSTKRFNNKVLDFIYRNLNVYAYKRSDFFLSISDQYLKDMDVRGMHKKKSYLLSHTIPLDKINRKTVKEPGLIVYAGSLTYTVDFVPLMQGLKLLLKSNIKFRFDVYGDGDQLPCIKLLVKEAGLEKHVNFKGVIDNDTLIREVLPKYSIGVCPYLLKRENAKADHMYTATDLTTKLVEYIAAGLPIVTTKISQSFECINENKFGMLVNDGNDWFRALKLLLEDPKTRDNFSKNALSYAKKYDEEMVLTPIFANILGEK